MASRNFNSAHMSLEGEVVKLYAKITIGGSGAATLTRGRGISTVAKGGTGYYTITLEDQYVRLLMCKITSVKATAIALQGQLNTEAVASTKILEIGIVDFDTPNFTEPSSGDIFLVELTLGNSDN